MDAIVLRRAIQDDAAALGALHVASWRETYAGILRDEMLAGLRAETRAAMWREILGDPGASGGAIVLVAEDGGQMVGFGSCGEQRDRALADAGFGGEIGAIYILRSHQDRGLGRAIMAAISQALSIRGHVGASLWVLRENAAARTFYERLGGEILGEKRDAQRDATLVELAYGWRDLSLLHR